MAGDGGTPSTWKPTCRVCGGMTEVTLLRRRFGGPPEARTSSVLIRLFATGSPGMGSTSNVQSMRLSAMHVPVDTLEHEHPHACILTKQALISQSSMHAVWLSISCRLNP